MIVLGLMSGTSMDGLDCCLSRIDIDSKNKIIFKVLDYETYEYSQGIKKSIIDTIKYKKNINNIDNTLGQFFLEKAILFLKNKKIDLISSHGQTISHINKTYSIQIGSPYYLSDYFKIPIMYDFRLNDILNNGTGAPLVPYLDWILFKDYDFDILTINIGGISNITYIPSNGNRNMVIGFDMGPGMCIIDLFVRMYWNKSFDNSGEISSRGNVDSNLLTQLLENSYISSKPPKSTSVEEFDIKYLNNIINNYKSINKYDFLRTLVNFTACTIAKNIDLFIQTKYKDENMKIILSGGGVKNKILMEDLNAMLDANELMKINCKGINIDNKESFLMCLLGFTAFKNIPNNMPSVTGADKEVVCGKLYE